MTRAAHPHLVVVTGGPGSGKTTLIEALAGAGHACIPEAGRAIIRAERASGGQALPWSDTAAYADAMLERDVAAYAAARASQGRVFFDRGLPDVAGYRQLAGLPFCPVTDGACRLHRYGCVFIAPPWREIYVNDAERRQDAAEAERTYHVMNEVYRTYGYEAIELPRASIVERVAFVLDRVG